MGEIYYEKREKVHKVRNRMHAERVKWEKSITRKGRKCTKFVI